MTYLSVRAVEYEFQQSLATRELVLEAENALDLENAIRELRSYTAPRSVNGSRPTEKKAILSLRDDLLGLEDRDAVPDGFYPLDATERLRLLLRSERYAVYSETGEYLGQRIPFELAPRGFEDERVTQIYSQDSCAERLWSVNASILGDDELLDGVDSTFTNITVMKSNTFFSQWCDESDRGTDYQLASVRPERNLFRDPQAGSSPIVDLHVRPMQGEGYAKALIQPTFNVDRASFEDDQYENGDSSQLAGRGLYGEYVLFFPAQSLSRIDKDGVSQPGLDLAHVDDVLIRLDYLTAAR